MINNKPTTRFVIATAGWSIPSVSAPRFPQEGSGLERYASVFKGVEVNSTFYDVHRDQTLARWAGSVPFDFHFAFKIPRAITHEENLAGDGTRLRAFARQLSMVGDKLGPLLVQLPPRLGYDPEIADRFLNILRSNFSGEIAFEPRHQSWLNAQTLFRKHDVALVKADPPVLTGNFQPVIKGRFCYIRLHGAPRIYYSSYAEDFIGRLADALLASEAALIWCVFDNTASGAAARNALDLKDKLQAQLGGP